ncbi:MAG TPA: acyl-CoA dehydrogenase family protein [Noviherbaspirillum sp.]|uniref:acyl-CoA dehydrogenase family protein n=1 Tax=Noviherbaspirillum sp. TaxID=1926288 RepID=UPI002B49077E|nr:acyl-CoA dehydrogenase family protein [Noviherbaspirillum sp.]HJV85191.1 acyl-CoA dehydrogenase family protein [Noviherbaspirillum sp.]
MAIALNQEQEMLRDSAMVFLRENAPVSQLRKLRDSRDETGFSRELWQSFADMGFTGVLIPEAYGGLGLGQVEAGVIMEAIGRNLGAVPFLSTAVLSASVLARQGSEEQRQKYLPAIADGKIVMALALDESSKHRPERQSLRATPNGHGFRLNGAKTFVVDGHVADTLVVAARIAGNEGDRDGISLFLVDRSSPGVQVERTIMVDAHNAARISFSDVEVEAGALIGASGEGWPLLEATLDAGRIALASELLGMADEVFTRTLDYLKERKQFGKIIGEFQALQHRAAHLYTEIEITRALVLRSQQMLDEGNRKDNGKGNDVASAMVSAAKARAGATAALAVQEGVQMHGGIGMTDEFEIGFFMKRQRVAQELLGDTNYHADRWARLSAY